MLEEAERDATEKQSDPISHLAEQVGEGDEDGDASGDGDEVGSDSGGARSPVRPSAAAFPKYLIEVGK